MNCFFDKLSPIVFSMWHHLSTWVRKRNFVPLFVWMSNVILTVIFHHLAILRSSSVNSVGVHGAFQEEDLCKSSKAVPSWKTN